jgi:uracil phosphoribosyltransferase
MVVVIGAVVWPFGVVKLQQQWSNCKIYVAMMMTNFRIRSFLRSTKEL